MTVTRREFLRTSLLAGSGVAVAPWLAQASGPATEVPNILFIICDDLNDSVAGMGGHPQAQTPHFDKLMARGVRFTNAQCANPICGPSRAALWSGLYPHTTGYFGYSQQQSPWRKNPVLKSAVTLHEYFARHGYTVFGCGKIHHNGHEDWSVFDNAAGQRRFGVRPDFGPYPWNGDPREKTWGSGCPFVPEELRKGWSDGFGPLVDLSAEFGGKGQWILHGGRPFKVNADGTRDWMPDERSVEWCRQTVLQTQQDRPWLLTVGLNRPHTPLYAPPEYFDRFPLDKIELAPMLIGDLDDVAGDIKRRGGTAFGKYQKLMAAGGEPLLRRWTQAYLACVAFVDDQTGALLAALERGPHAENTLVIVTSDHGYHMGEKECLFKDTIWEESMRVPFVAAGPGVARGAECATPVSLVDVYPTLVDCAGLPHRQPLDGHSMRPLFASPAKGEWTGPAAALSCIWGEPTAPNQPGHPARQHYTLRSARYRYVRCANDDEEFYDHATDPHEWHNLAGDPAARMAISQLAALLPAVTKRNGEI